MPLPLFACVFCLLLNSIVFARDTNIGFSGMAQMDANRYLVVMDKKSHHTGARLGIFSLHAQKKPSFTSLTVNEWKHPDGQASDLESVCKLPNSINQYLVSESGYWKGRNGRIFHITVENVSVTVNTVYMLPLYQSNDEEMTGDNFEGLLCVAHRNDIWVILGERGGSSLYPSGKLRPGKLLSANDIIKWYAPEQFAIDVTPQGSWTNKKGYRSISDLYLDDNGMVWASATEDKGDLGPFNSLIWSIGYLQIADENVAIKPAQQKSWQITGLKVEALAGPAALAPESIMSMGSEDEDLGGVWRPLLP
ncbi:MAG: hypothetical protein ACFHVJ_06630 [Aestuariibacter sp.]